MPTLFTPLAAGRLQLPNRVLMAPMTRSRADDQGLVGPLTAQYYAQRASAGLIISEGIWPEPMGRGYVRTPGLATPAHVAAWRTVTTAVHGAGGRIVAQIMHTGRISDPSLLPGGATPVAPSAVRPDGGTWLDGGMQPHVTPRALSLAEVQAIIDNHALAAMLAIEAGFDGVELHGGNGYLGTQFLSSNTNLRTDVYGGTAMNRARFVVETLEAISAAIGADRTGLKITPGKTFNDIQDANPEETYTTLLKAIKPIGLAFLEVAPDAEPVVPHAVLKPLFDGAYFAGSGYTHERAAAALTLGEADAALFGQLFIANPDLPRRFAFNAPLAQADAGTFYAGGAHGYVDYPPLQERLAAE